MDFWCLLCGAKNTFNRRYVEATDRCVACLQMGRWRTNDQPVAADVEEPKVAYELSVNDRRFLRSLRIGPD